VKVLFLFVITFYHTNAIKFGGKEDKKNFVFLLFFVVFSLY